MRRVGLICDNVYQEHITSDYHPEHPNRLAAINAVLDTEEMRNRFTLLQPREATGEEIQRVHTGSYFQRIESTSNCGHMQLDPDTHLSSETYRVAKLAAGGLCLLIDKLFSGEIHNGFALIRPPGHHAEQDRGMGFCIYNNVAVAARYAQEKGLAEKVLIIDWDLHHGNGTQHTFESDASVLYFSTHQFPFYPGTGRGEEIGIGDGTGYTVNIPLPGGQDEGDFVYIYREILHPIADQFKPDLILVSAGFDIYRQDPLGSMGVTETGFSDMTRILMKVADAHCQGRILFTLEGGYHIQGQAQGVKNVLNTLHGEPHEPVFDKGRSKTVEKILQNVRTIHQPYWRF